MATEAQLQAQIALNRERDRLVELARTNICYCDGELVVAWIGGEYVLRCGKDKSHEGIKPKSEHHRMIERQEREDANSRNI
ncbi:hypothetical protein LCGC14_0498760 [marine sediment metagenome]|uniref:Uncharacterized protein n=1 Tax=marine sediment metagenome TaxID=412755 RepID=A0A0F9SN79_9ZZZZ